MWRFTISSTHRWFTAHPRMVSLFFPPYSPFLNPIEEFFSSWSLWPQSTWSDVSLWCNEWWMSGHSRLPGMDQACKKILSQVYCKRGHKVWYMNVNMCSFVLHYWNYFSLILCTWVKKCQKSLLKHIPAFLIHFCGIYYEAAQSCKKEIT